MKLSVSNVAWYNNRIEEFIRFVSGLGCRGIELGPSMIWPEPVLAPVSERRALKTMIADAGLDLAGIQALLYSRQDLFLFGDAAVREKMLEYLTGMMDLCGDLGGEVLVFGSPRNRKIGNLPQDKARAIAVGFFRELGIRAGKRGLYFCIEPLGRTETDFINTVAEAFAFIQEAGNPEGLGLHIDTKGIIDEREVDKPYLADMFAIAKHVHISEPDLRPVGTGSYNHRPISRKIRSSGYNRFISIEMRRNEGAVEKTIAASVKYVQDIYCKGELP
ncbi:MAG: Xylose isomerase-like TIM barrel [Methanoregula sp. PtaU1.Bin051]|nr:MAG: Xylose isomerase-like TIM barrel [Methanoregula sp. PtaU1.Bin051]